MTQQSSLQFQATQELGAGLSGQRVAYNWLTQASVDTFRDVGRGAGSVETQTTLLGGGGGRVVSLAAEQDVMRLRRRFLRDRSSGQVKFHARKQVGWGWWAFLAWVCHLERTACTFVSSLSRVLLPGFCSCLFIICS